MKRLMSLLLVLAFAAPAMAPPVLSDPVLIYNWKEKIIEMELEAEQWYQWKENLKGYIVLEPNAPDEANIWFIETWKEKDLDGKMRKYYYTDGPFTLELIKADLGKKTVWVLISMSDQHSLILTGDAKPTKIGGEKFTIPKKFDGTFVWDEPQGDDDRDFGTAKESLRLHPRRTAEAKEAKWTGRQAADAIADHLERKGYVED